ncbi:MAG TPA: GAF domain-containing protein [Aeromicrobium sp.]|nr:GAF domain-containing protein [Aeromicrobium sp.]
MADQMRSEVADSWHRSVAAGVEREDIGAPITLDDSALRDHRAAHPLSRVFPLLDDVLGQAARDCNALMAVSDEAGQLLWVCGTPQTLRKADRMGFVEGSNWDEGFAGTSAPGLALRLDKPVSIVRAEHFRQSVKDWSCAAIPIHDPATSRLLGVLDITGGDEIVVPQTLALVRAVARLAEAELARELPSEAPAATGVGVKLGVESLGRHESLISLSDGRGRNAKFRLSPRHSEIVLLLASAPRGLSGDELMVLLYEEDPAAATLRAELKRLRHFLGEDLLASRPYRLEANISGDWLEVEGRLAAGDLRGAMRLYRGPLLPRSTGPGIVRLRDGLHESMRAALLSSKEPDLMSTWTRSAWGQDDYEMWLAQRETAAASSPLLSLINGQLARLDRDFG